MAEDGRVELRVGLPAGLLRLLGEAAGGASMDEIVEDALAAMLRREAAAPAPAGDAGPEAGGPVLPVLAVGDAAEVLARLDALGERMTTLAERVAATDERTRRIEVWIKTVLAELFIHLTPFPSPAEERERREKAGARLDEVDKDVRWYVDEYRAADGGGGTVPRTS